MAASSNTVDPQFRIARERERDKSRECEKVVEKGNKYGADELKVYIKKQKEIRKYRELQEFEERERLLESKKQRLKELDVKCKQIAYKKQSAQLTSFPVSPQQFQSQNSHHLQRDREIRETIVAPHRFSSHTVTSTTITKNVSSVNDRDRNSHGLTGKPKVKRTKYTNQEMLIAHGHGQGQGQGLNEGSVLVNEAKKSNSNCKLERQAASFIFKEFENIVRRECKNLLRTRSSQFQHSVESSSSMGSNSNSKSEINLHYRDQDCHRERDRDDDRDRDHGRNRNRNAKRDRDRSRDSSHSNSHSNSRDNKERKLKSKITADKSKGVSIPAPAAAPTHSGGGQSSLSGTTVSTNTYHNHNQNHSHSHSYNNHRSDRDRDRPRERVHDRERGVVTKVDKNVGTSFLLYDSLDNRDLVSSDGCSSIDVDGDDSRSQFSGIKPLSSSKGFHSLFQNQKLKHHHCKQKPHLTAFQQLQEQRQQPPYIIPRPTSQELHPRQSQSQQQIQIPENVKHAAAARIQAAYKSYKIRSILSEAKLRARNSTSSTVAGSSNYSLGGAGNIFYGNGKVNMNNSTSQIQNENQFQNQHQSDNRNHRQYPNNANISYRHRPMSPAVEYSSGDSLQDINNRTKAKMTFYKPSQSHHLIQNQNQTEKGISLTRSQPTPEKPYDERSQRHISAYSAGFNGNGVNAPGGEGRGTAAGAGIPRPGLLLQGPAHTPVKPNPEDIPGYIPPPAGYGFSPTPRATSYSPRTLPLLRLRHVDEPFPKQVLENLDTSSHSLHGQCPPTACQSPVKLISSISKFQMPYSLQHSHSQQMSSPAAPPPPPAPVTFIPKPSSHPPSFLLESKTKKLIHQQQQQLPSSIGQYQYLHQPKQQRYTASSSGVGPGVQSRSHKVPTSSLAAGAVVHDSGFGAGTGSSTAPQQSQPSLITIQNQMKKTPPNLMDLPDPVFTTVLQEKIRLLKNNQNQGQSYSQQNNIPSSSTRVAATSTMDFGKSSPIKRSQMNAVSKATEQIKKKIVEAKQILEDYKMELLRTNSSSNLSRIGDTRVGDGVSVGARSNIDGDITYESDFDIDSQSVSQLLQQDQESVCGHDSEILQSLEPDVPFVHSKSSKLSDRERLERDRLEREKEAVAARYTIPRPRPSTSLSTSGSRTRSRSSRDHKDVDQRTKTKLPVPVPSVSVPVSASVSGSETPTPSDATSAFSEQQQLASPRSVASSIPSRSNAQDQSQSLRLAGSGSRSKSVASSVRKSTVSESIQVSEREDFDDINIHANVSSRSSNRAKTKESTNEAKDRLLRQSLPAREHQKEKETRPASVASSDSITPVPVPATVPQGKAQEHESDTDYEDLAPTVSRASSNLPTEDVVYDMDFDTDLQSSVQSRSVASKSKSKSVRGNQLQQQQQVHLSSGSGSGPAQQPQVQQKQLQRRKYEDKANSSNASVIIDLDVTTGKKSDELPSEQNSLSFSLSLNAQGQQQHQVHQQQQKHLQRQQSVSVGPDADAGGNVGDESGDDDIFDIEENLPSAIMSSFAIDEIISASIKEQGHYGAAEEPDINESIAEDFVSQKSVVSSVSSPSHSSHNKKGNVIKSKEKGQSQPQFKDKDRGQEPTSKDTTVFDEKVDSNMSVSIPSIAYDFEDFETDASVSQSLQNVHNVPSQKEKDQTKAKQEVEAEAEVLSSVGIDLDLPESDLKDETILEEEVEEAEDAEDLSEEIEIDSGMNFDAAAATAPGTAPVAVKKEAEIEDSFLSEIPEDIDNSVTNTNLSFSQIQQQSQLPLRNQTQSQSSQRKPESAPEPELASPVTTTPNMSVSSVSEDIPSSQLTPIDESNKDETENQEAGNDISGKIVGEMDSILSDASNIPEDHPINIVAASDVVDVDFDADADMVSETHSHSKSQDQSTFTQKSAMTDFSQQANFNIVKNEKDYDVPQRQPFETLDTSQVSQALSESKVELQGIQKSQEKVLTSPPQTSPVPGVDHGPLTAEVGAESDEEISEIAEDLPLESGTFGNSESEGSGRSQSQQHTHLSSKNHDACDNDAAKFDSKSASLQALPETELAVPFLTPTAVIDSVSPTPVPTTWDAELSGKISVSTSEIEKSDLPIKIDVQIKTPVNNLNLLSAPVEQESEPESELERLSKVSEISEDIPKTATDASPSMSGSEKIDKSQSKSGKGKVEADLKEIVTSKIQIEQHPLEPQPDPEIEQQQDSQTKVELDLIKTTEVSTQSDSDSFLASIASQVSEILSKSKSKSKTSSKRVQLSKNEKDIGSVQQIPVAITVKADDVAAKEFDISETGSRPNSQKSRSQSKSEVEVQEAEANLLDLAKTMDTDIIEKIESLIADEISKQIELEEKESQSTISEAMELDTDDSKFSLASYANFHVEDVVYESDFDVETEENEPSQQSKSDKSGKSKSEKSKSVTKSKSSASQKHSHSGLLEAVVKNEVGLLITEQNERQRQQENGNEGRLEKHTEVKTGDGDFIRNTNTIDLLGTETTTATSAIITAATDEDINNKNMTVSSKLSLGNQFEVKLKPKLGVEARVRTIIENKETMDGLVNRIIARMLKEVSAARSVTFKEISLSSSDSGTNLQSKKDNGSVVGKKTPMQAVDEDDDRSVSAHDEHEHEVDVDDPEWFEDDLITGANTVEDESLKREAAEIVAEQMRIENEIRALEALQAQVPATLLNLSDVPDKPPPPYSPPSSDSASLGLRSFAIQYTQKQLQDLVRNQVDLIWNEWTSNGKLPQYDYVDESDSEFSLKIHSPSLDETGEIVKDKEKENEPSGGDTTTNPAQNTNKNTNKKDKELSKAISVPIPVLSTSAFNTLLFDLIKDTIKEILLIEDETSVGKDYVDRIRPGSLTIAAQKMRIPKTKEGLFEVIYMKVKNLLPYPLLANDVPVPRRRLTKWTSRPRDLVDEVLAEELIDEDREWTESWPEEILVIDRWAEKFSRRAVREVMGAFKAVFTTTTSV